MDERKAKIKELYEKAALKRKFAAELADLEEQRQELAYNAEVLRNVMELEEEDVKRLEKTSISNFFIELSGRMGEKMNQERREAYAAAAKYHAAAAELENIEKTMAAKQAELEKLADCEELLQKEVAEAVEEAKVSGGESGAKIVELEKKILEQGNRIRELNEALNAGNYALNGIDTVLSDLGSAERWGTWDLFGGGLISSIAKHEKLNEAQAGIENLQHALSRFRTELSDVHVNSDIQIGVDEFMSFADWFFDGFLVDGLILDKIHKAQNQVYELEQQILHLTDRLQTSLRHAEAEKSRLKAALEQIVAG